MCRSISCFLFILALFLSGFVAVALAAQEPSGASSTNPVAASPPSTGANAALVSATGAQITVPVGTRLPLLLRNGINTRAAKAGDSVYFETAYPIAVDNRIVIPMGSFVRGEILEAKRPGRIKGRGEFRIALEQMTFPNGYTIELRATPSSVDRDGRESVDTEGRIKGPSSAGRDTAIVLAASGGGAYIGTLVGAINSGAPGRGALIGGGIGGLSALIAVLATRGPEAELPHGTMMDVVFDRPLILDAAYIPINNGVGVDPQPRSGQGLAENRQNLKEVQKRRIEKSILQSLLLTRF
jgi:hypothetical protein